MGNPIGDLWHAALAGFKASADFFASEWRALYDEITLQDFEAHTRDALFRLAQALEFSTVMAADSLSDAMRNGEQEAQNTRDALWFLRFAAIPDAGLAAERHADYVAALRARQAWLLAWSHILREAADRVLGDLRERLALDVAIAQEHADMVTRVAIERNDRILEIDAVRAQLVNLIARTKADILAFVDQVRQQLQQQVTQLSQYAHSIPGLVDKAAASGYDPTLQAHATALTRLFDAAVAHEPLVSGIVGRLAGWLTDLAEIDNPVIRIAAQLVLKEIIDRVGLDTALGKMLGALLGPVLSGGPPKTLAAVTAQAGDRLNGAETALAALAPLAPEADQLAEMGTLTFDAALLAYLAAAVTSPRAAADDTTAALDPVVTPLLAPVRGLLGMP